MLATKRRAIGMDMTKKETENTTEDTPKKMSFQDLGLSDLLLDAINKKGFEEPSEIQALTIPVMLENNHNIIAQAQTGTGKTAAFGLPLIQLIDEDKNNVQAIVLVPTRELAIQVAEEILSLRGNKMLRIIPIYGGQSIDEQLRRLRKGVHIVVGTPGRVIDHLKRKTLRLENIDHLILDEADEMLNMGFVEDIEDIMKYTNQHKKTLLFSATMPERIKKLATKYMDTPRHLIVKKQRLTNDLTEQIYFEVRGSEKFEALCRIIDIEENFYGLVFCRTKNDVDTVVGHLLERGYDAESIHGDISQGQRERTLEKFRKKHTNILIATDVAARGIDVIDLTHVINYSLPHDPESYVHRIGRTGRAGKQGTAVTFITPAEYSRLMFIQRQAKAKIKKATIPGVQEIIETKKKKISENVNAVCCTDINESYIQWAEEMLKDQDPKDVLAAFLSYKFKEELNPSSYGHIKQMSSKDRHIDQQGKARLFVALGTADNMNAPKLIEFISKRINITSDDIRDIQVLNTFSFITVPFDLAESIVQTFREKGRKPLITHAKNKERSGGGSGGGYKGRPKSSSQGGFKGKSQGSGPRYKEKGVWQKAGERRPRKPKD